MKIYVLAVVLMAAPVAGVVAMHPASAKRCISDAKDWAIRTFPKPKVKAPVRHG